MYKYWRIVVLCGLFLGFGAFPALATGCPSQDFDLSVYGAKGNTLVGKVVVWNDADYLYVQFSVLSSWVLLDTHLDISASPFTARGAPGQYKFNDYETTLGYYQIPVGMLPLPADPCGGTLYLLAQAELDKNGDGVADETAYGGVITKPRNGAWYGNIEYAWCCAEEQEELEYKEETAYAYATDGICFIDEGFGNWGWTIPISEEGVYTFALYAGAGQCNLAKGTYVGTVAVTYGNGTVTVDFNLELGYELVEQHVYAGKTMFPKDKKGNDTVAPGQYYIEDDLSGAIYVIVHAVVGWWE